MSSQQVKRLWRVDAQHAVADGAVTRFFVEEADALRYGQQLERFGWYTATYEEGPPIIAGLRDDELEALTTLSWPVLPTSQIHTVVRSARFGIPVLNLPAVDELFWQVTPDHQPET